MIEIKVEEKDIRIDQYLGKNLDYSRSKIEKLIKNKDILVNNKEIKKSYTLKEGDIITINEIVEEEIEVTPEKMDLNIVYEDDDVIVVNKDNGVVVHPGAGNYNHTLVNGLMYHSKLSSINGEFRPGIVHRIDAYTTGLLMVAKNDKAHIELARQLEEKTTYRKYVALVWGVINTDTGTIDAPIGRDNSDRKKMTVTDVNAKDAVTHFKVLERYANTTLIELQLETGRTHQIRVHMNYIGYPIVNDPVYGRRKIIDDTGQCLHAKELGFKHPVTGKYMEFTSELPECFTNILNQFKD
ncbi:MAG: RluA family pseudouridine synthase [Lactobacillales bacterium]|nr:RluA family pseudouridine synthase [Lactobacillales bacterium]